MLFFMVVAPTIQYISGFSVWDKFIDDEYYILTNIYITIFNLVYLLIYKISIKKNKSKVEKNKKSDSISCFVTKKHVLILLIISLICFLLSIKIIGFNNLFIRENNSLGLDDGTLNSIFTKLIRVLPTYSAVVSILYFKKNKNIRNFMYILIALLITFILNYPSSVTRYWIGTIYIGIFLILFSKKMRTRTFDFLLITVFLFIFPFFLIMINHFINISKIFHI